MRYLVTQLLLVLAIATNVEATQFSAHAVMSTPGSSDLSTHIYYSPGRIRKEFYYYGEPVIQILDANKHVSLMCFAHQKLCYENTSQEEISIGIDAKIDKPCTESKDVACQNLGEHLVNNRKTIKWKIITKVGNQEQVSQLWLDKEFSIPIKQTLVNGASVELEWLGSEKLGNRETEKWIQQIKLPDGETKQSYQWFDKELKISIREAFPNGNSQELKQIVVENLPDTLFTMPTGFHKKTIDNPQNLSNVKKIQ